MGGYEIAEVMHRRNAGGGRGRRERPGAEGEQRRFGGCRMAHSSVRRATKMLLLQVLRSARRRRRSGQRASCCSTDSPPRDCRSSTAPRMAEAGVRTSCDTCTARRGGVGRKKGEIDEVSSTAVKTRSRRLLGSSLN